nr:hypothetical protein [Lachnospiraceae bacterium]
MRQINFTYGDFYEAVENLHNIKSSVSYNSPSNVLLHIYVSNISLEQTEIITALLDSTMPDVPRIGITEFPVVNKNTPKNSVRINVLIAENSDFFPFQITCERGSEKDVAIAFLKQIKEIENIKGIEFCYANQLIDTVAFIDTIRNELKNIPIFGSLSKSADIVNGKIILNAACFSIGRKITTDGISAIVYCGENLSIDIKVLQSWRPIGRNLKIKLEENTMLGSTAISEIDNLPATDIFHKYLGVAIDENFLNHVWFFPLTVNRNSENICLIPTGYNGQTFYFNGRISKDESVNFAYCTQEDIIKDTYNETKKINDKTPEALFLNICNNRSAFMKEEESRELELFANCVKEFCFSHSFGEIAYQNEYSDILNSASV